MSFPLNSRVARGRRGGGFSRHHRTRATSLSPSRQFRRVCDLAYDRVSCKTQLVSTPSPPRRSSPTPSPPLSLDALDLDGAEENDLDLECVVCCELYDTSVHAPMVLPCSGAHEICRTCVAALRKADGAIQCPKCREDATGAVNPNRGLIAALRLSRRS